MDRRFRKRLGPLVIYGAFTLNEPPSPNAGVHDPWLETYLCYRLDVGNDSSVEEYFHTRLTVAERWILLSWLYKWVARVIKARMVVAVAITHASKIMLFRNKC